MVVDRGNMSNKEWADLYAKGGYDGVGSGRGSLLKNNYKLIDWLTEFIKKEDISTILVITSGIHCISPQPKSNIVLLSSFLINSVSQSISL